MKEGKLIIKDELIEYLNIFLTKYKITTLLID